MTLYRKFRPDTFSSVKEQTVITDILRSSVKSGKISHAYLFTGNRGIGKTTTARIFAKAINCLHPVDGNPCNKCKVCETFNNGTNVDLIEIDAASNRGIDDIREIKEKVNFSPVMSRYKVYIIDEVHMLTKDAFNAILKTLEEPPEHVVFILATTEIFKVPVTIISRCQRFDFKNASMKQLQVLLTEIGKKEKISIDTEAIHLIAELAEGSFRDSLTILEKLSSMAESITYDSALTMLGIPEQKVITSLLEAMLGGDFVSSLTILQQSIADGIDLYQLNKNILLYLEKQLIASATNTQIIPVNESLYLIKEFLTAEERLKYSVVPQAVMETVLVGVAMHYPQTQSKQKSTEKKQEIVVEKKVVIQKPKETKKELTGVLEPQKEEKSKEEVKSVPATSTVSLEDVKEKWAEVIIKVMPFNHHLSSFLSKANPIGIEGNKLVLEVKYSFHKDRIEDPKSRVALGKIFMEVVGANLTPSCEINSKLNITKLQGAVIKQADAIEKKEQITDNVIENISIASVDSDLLQEAMKIFEME
jgi:DNA polymerase-3 subunit gamma/tau